MQAAKTPAELRALAAELARNPINTAKPKQAAPAPAPEATPPAQEQPAAVEPATAPEETQPAEGETPAEESATPEAAEEGGEPDEADGGDGPVTPLTGKRAHLRLPENDQVGRLAAALMKRNRDMSMVEAVARASEQLGVSTQTASEKQPENESTPKAPKTVQEVDTLTKETLANYKKAMEELRFGEAADLQAQLIKLSQHRSNIERNAERATLQAEAQYHQGFEKSNAKAIELYPFAADPKSPGGKRMLEIERTLEQNGDPLFHSPDKPLRIAQMVAAELSIAPRSKTPPAKPAAAPAAPAPKKGIVTTGSSSTQPAAHQPPAIDTQAKNVKNVHELRKLLRSVGVNSV